MKKKAGALLLTLILCFSMAVPALAADYTFQDRYGATRTVKDGEYSFATRVVEFTPGKPWTSVDYSMDPAIALGKPEYVSGSYEKGDLCLGAGGVLVLEFNISIIDGEGEDVYVFETGGDVEATKVEVSNDLRTWYEAGVAQGKTAGVDLNGKVPEGGRYRYVRLTDLKQHTGGRWPGADIDAVLALNSKPVTSDWSETEIEKAEKYDLIPDILQHAVMTEPITRLEFAALSVKVFENLSATKALPAVNNPFVDCKDLEMRKAYNLGITNGTSDTTFTPNGLLTREQAATMLTRTFKRSVMPGWSLDRDGQPQYKLNYTMPKRFADDAKISGYAWDSVYFMASHGIIGGIGNNLFAPNNQTSEEQARGYANATREQALAIAVRMVENLDH